MSDTSINQTPPETVAVHRRPSLMINAISNWAALAANMLVGFMVTPFIVRTLDKSGFGIYDLVTMIVGYSGLLEMGITSAIIRYAALYAGRRDLKSLSQVASTALLAFSMIGASFFLFCTVLRGPMSHFFSVAPGDRETFQSVVMLLGLSAGITFPCTVLTVVVLAHERYVLSNIAIVLVAMVRGVALYAILSHGGGLIGLSWVNVFVASVTLLVNLFLIYYFLRDVRLTPKSFSLKTARELFSFGIFTFLNKIGELLRFNMGRLVIGKFMNMGDVAIYGLGAMVFKNIYKVTISCSGVTQPRLASLADKDTMDVFRRSFLHYSAVVSTFTVIVGVTALLVAPDFLRIWIPLKAQDVQLAIWVFFILLVGLLPNIMTDVSYNALQAVNKHPIFAYQTVIEGVINLGLAVLFINLYHSILWVAIAAAIPSLTIKIIIQPIYVTRIIGVSWRDYFYRVFVRPVVVLGTLAGIVVLVEKYVGGALTAHSYPTLVVKSEIIFFIVCLTALMLCFERSFRKSIYERVARIPLLARVRVNYSPE